MQQTSSLPAICCQIAHLSAVGGPNSCTWKASTVLCVTTVTAAVEFPLDHFLAMLRIACRKIMENPWFLCHIHNYTPFLHSHLDAMCVVCQHIFPLLEHLCHACSTSSLSGFAAFGAAADLSDLPRLNTSFQPSCLVLSAEFCGFDGLPYML